MNNEAAYSRPVTLKSILRFAVPTIAMSVFMSFYTMVDGLFVSNLIGTNALSSINLVYPIIALVTAISTMLATGGSAAIMKKLYFFNHSKCFCWPCNVWHWLSIYGKLF